MNKIIFSLTIWIVLFNACSKDSEPLKGRYEKRADFPGLSRYGAVGFNIADNIYIVTGANRELDTIIHCNIYLSELWRYNPVSDAWTRKADFTGEGGTSEGDFQLGTRDILEPVIHVQWGMKNI